MNDKMKKFDYKKYGKEYQKAIEYVVTTVARWSENKQNDKIYISLMINDYIENSEDYKHLSKKERNMLIDEVIEKYNTTFYTLLET